MFNYFKRKKNKLVCVKLFSKYFNKSIYVIKMLLNEGYYFKVFKTYLGVSLNCLVNGYFIKILRLNRLVLIKIYKP